MRTPGAGWATDCAAAVRGQAGHTPAPGGGHGGGQGGEGCSESWAGAQGGAYALGTSAGHDCAPCDGMLVTTCPGPRGASKRP